MWKFRFGTFSLLGIFLVCAQENNRDDCECVAFYLCRNDSISENVIDISARPNNCDYLEKCCKKTDQLPVTSISTRSSLPESKTGCGYRNPNGVNYRISGDEDNEAQFGEFPWTVAIMTKSKNDAKPIFKCGGSLLHPQVVLTAAHCVYGTPDGARSFIVRAGEWDTQTTQERYKHQERSVTSGVIHRGYDNSTVNNDVALLFLESPFDISEHINVACLPPENSVILSKHCFVTGWGKDKFEQDGIYQSILKKIELPIFSREKCQPALRETRLGSTFTLHRSFMCAGGEQNQDACTGDGGGPLVCPIPDEEDRYQQVGIVAWGIGCGTKGVPGVYVDVAYFRSWIDQQMEKKKFSSDSYKF